MYGIVGLHDEGIVSGHTPLPGSKSAVNANLTKFISYKQYNLIRMAVVQRYLRNVPFYERPLMGD